MGWHYRFLKIFFKSISGHSSMTPCVNFVEIRLNIPKFLNFKQFQILYYFLQFINLDVVSF